MQNTETNRQELALHIWDSMDLDDACEYVTSDLIQRMEQDDDEFQELWSQYME